MAHPTLLPTGPDTDEWRIWTTTARLVVTDPAALPGARRLVDLALAAVDDACNRFRPDSELRRLELAHGRPTAISPLLAELVDAALVAAQRTGGDVDPTLGLALAILGDGPVRAAPGWRQIRRQGVEITIPAGVRLDLGAIGKAFAADLCAGLVASSCDTGVLVSLGGDIATAGRAPAGGWSVLVCDGPGEPNCTVRIAGGMALATSSTRHRRWHRGDRLLHHILDPRTCQPATPVWRTVSVAAPSCVDANTQSTAAVVRGLDAPSRIEGPARLVAADGSVRTVNGWPR